MTTRYHCDLCMQDRRRAFWDVEDGDPYPTATITRLEHLVS